LIGHITKTLYTDEISCGLRCLQDEKCQSYNSKSHPNDAKKECQLSNQTEKSSPENLRRNPRSTYYGRGTVRGGGRGEGGYEGSEYFGKRGLDSAHPAFSCKEILNSGHSKGDGEYWIDPEKSGNPLKVYCDMSRYGGGWLLVSNVEFGSPSSKVSVETSYRGIGKSYMVLQKSAMKELRRHLSFTQLRFHCHKKQGRTFHVVTTSNSSGEAVVQYFSGQTDEQPDACGSFVSLKWDDNSKLADICKDWGLVSGEYLVGKWGHGEDQNRLYWYPAFKVNAYHLRVHLNNVGDLNEMQCDDGAYQTVNTIGDFWRVFVR
ncbi:unnamed protein product, partial [Pocillopora meandrina]